MLTGPSINDDDAVHRHADALARERTAQREFEQAKTNAETAAAALEDHDRRRTDSTEALARATRTHAELIETEAECEQTHLERRRALEQSIANGAPCPTCHRPWPHAAETARQRIHSLDRTRANERNAAQERIASALRTLDDTRLTARAIDEERSTHDFTAAARAAIAQRHDAERAYLEASEAARAATATYAAGSSACALNNARREHAVIEGQIKTLAEQHEALAATPGVTGEHDTPDLVERMSTLEKRLDIEQRQRDAARIKHDADTAATNADAWAKAARTLSAEHGIRHERTHEAIACAMEWLERINTITGDFGAATINDGTLRWNDLPVEMASTAERWCAYTWLRLALSNRLGEYIHIADGADTLVPSWRTRARDALGRIAETTGITILWTEAVDAPPQDHQLVVRA